MPLPKSEHGAQVAGTSLGDHGRTHAVPAPDSSRSPRPRTPLKVAALRVAYTRCRPPAAPRRSAASAQVAAARTISRWLAGDIASGRRGNREYSGANHHRDLNNQVPPGEVLRSRAGGPVGRRRLISPTDFMRRRPPCTRPLALRRDRTVLYFCEDDGSRWEPGRTTPQDRS